MISKGSEIFSTHYIYDRLVYMIYGASSDIEDLYTWVDIKISLIVEDRYGLDWKYV
jgi:hypothetical protein